MTIRSRLFVRFAWIACVVSLLLPPTPSAAQRRTEITDETVRIAIERGVSYLKRRQDDRGRWSEHPITPGGVSALCTLALINSGVPQDDPNMRAAMAFVRRPKGEKKTYSMSLETMVLCAATPAKDRPEIRSRVTWLQQNQISNAKSASQAGSWSYGNTNATSGDPSNTQFALLALHEAERVGIDVQPTIWRRSLGYWTRLQRPDGSWGYDTRNPSSGSMTCAGITSTIIALGQATEGDAKVDGDQVMCCQPQADQAIPLRGVEWLAKNFSVANNPAVGADRQVRFSQSYYFYYMYGMERVGRMTGNRFIGQHDWYREGAEVLLGNQDPNGSWRGSGFEQQNPEVATALALLFLSKGRRPVLVAKYKPNDGDDWNRHRRDLNNLTRYVERRWQRDLTWQTIDGSVATVEDLLQTPVLYLSGRDGLRLRPDQKQTLKQYIDQGGFVFAESCCEGGGFETDFRALMAELFPDSPMRLLPPDHPVWYAEQKVAADKLLPLFGVDACCRTSVVFCPGELSCYWELGSVQRERDLPETVESDVKARLAIGANVLTYATNRELKEKLDVPLLVSSQGAADPNARATLYVAKLRHNGGSDDAPAALGNLLKLSGEVLKTRISSDKRLLSPTDDGLADYPIVFVHGRRDFRWTLAERKALALYVERGGFILADSICSSDAFASAFRREMRAIFPQQPLQRVALDHSLFSTAFQGYDLATVKLRGSNEANDGRTDEVAN